MKLKTLRACAVALLISISFSATAHRVQAVDYSAVFQEIPIGTGSSYTAGRSPCRNNANNDVFPRVNSKNNQARDQGSNPHQGTDINMNCGNSVFPIFAGTIDSIVISTLQLGSVTISCYDSNIGNFYVKYLHINPAPSLVSGQTVTVDSCIGTIAADIDPLDDKVGYSPHLHLQMIVSQNPSPITGKLFPFFRTVSDWNLGYDLDYFAGEYTLSTNLFYITAYTCSSGTRSQPYSVTLYYRVGANGTWQSAPMTLAYGYRYMINLKTATGASTGQTVYYYVVALRSTNLAYGYCVYPQYYKQPGIPLSNSYAQTIQKSWIIT